MSELTTLDYENHAMMKGVRDALRPHVKEGERLIYRGPFRWRDDADEQFLSNHYECQDIEYLADTFEFEIVANFHHAAIVKRRLP